MFTERPCNTDCNNWINDPDLCQRCLDEKFEIELDCVVEEDKGFEIKCLNCKSINVVVESIYDYDWEDNLICDGFEIICKDCGQCG